MYNNLKHLILNLSSHSLNYPAFSLAGCSELNNTANCELHSSRHCYWSIHDFQQFSSWICYIIVLSSVQFRV